MIFKNRKSAGELLAQKLLKYQNHQPLILALPRGGVPVAAEIAEKLDAALEVLAVRKIGAPFNPELALGAICEDVLPHLSDSLLSLLDMKESELNDTIRVEKKEIQRQIQKFRQGKKLPDLIGKVVILVDDGLATGATMMAAVRYVRSRAAGKIIVAVPIAASSSAVKFRGKVDEFLALEEQENLLAVGHWFEDFKAVTDEEVIKILKTYRKPQENLFPHTKSIEISENGVRLTGELTSFENMKAMIIFTHGSGSSRYSPRNVAVSRKLNSEGFGTLLFDLLTLKEAEKRENIFNVPLLAQRLEMATRFIFGQDFNVPVGYFGASTGAAAAMKAAASFSSPNPIYAIVSRGGRPDLASEDVSLLKMPALLLVGEWDDTVVELNRSVARRWPSSKLVIIPGAGHIFEEPGTLEQVAEEAGGFFSEKLAPRASHFKSFKNSSDFVDLCQKLKDSRIVMLGESSHGTHEYYEIRSQISKILISEYGFNFIAVEGDWPDAFRLNQYIQKGIDRSAREVLMKNKRWPTWMWANSEIAHLAEWMRGRGAGFYGLDVYSLFDSMNEVVKYLNRKSPEVSKIIRKNYSCFEPFKFSEISYAQSLLDFPEGCRDEVLESLQKILQLRLTEANKDGAELFSLEQNARVAANAENYYRAMLEDSSQAWNVRDAHMLETLDHLLDFYGKNSKAIVWAHNTHIGDYRATDMVNQGSINLGGLARQSFGPEVVSLVGFGSYAGTVTAGSAWGAPEKTVALPPAKPESLEWHLHQRAKSFGWPQFSLDLKASDDPLFNEKVGHRAVGVVYNPSTETRSQYVPTVLSRRYDHFIFLDETTALKSLHAPAVHGEMPETWPVGQ